jgi:hypothetical protein
MTSAMRFGPADYSQRDEDWDMVASSLSGD